MKIVINNCYGGYGLSKKAIKKIYKRKGQKVYFYSSNLKRDKIYKINDINSEQFCFYVTNKDLGDETTTELLNEASIAPNYDIPRNDPDLVAVVKMLKSKACDNCSELKIIEIPDDVEWEISDYDGMESVEEKHQSWN